MISYPEARRYSPNPERDAARKELADALRQMRRDCYDAPHPDWKFMGHLIARAYWKSYRERSARVNRLILQEAKLNGQAIN